MKEVYKELKKIFDEYGSVCLGIAALIVVGWCTGWLVTCGIVGLLMWLLGLSYNWIAGTVAWIAIVVTLKIAKKRMEKDANATEWS